MKRFLKLILDVFLGTLCIGIVVVVIGGIAWACETYLDAEIVGFGVVGLVFLIAAWSIGRDFRRDVFGEWD